MQKNIVKTSRAYDFLALVPQLLGFLPEKSIVLVAFRGNRTCGAMRFNLPDADAPDKVHKRIATTLVGMLCKIPGVDAVVPVAYVDDSFGAVPGVPHARFAEALVARAELAGFLVRDALCVGADGWGSYLEPDCPAGGHPLSDITASEVHQAIPADARRDLAALRSGAELPAVDLAVKERLARRLAGLEGLARRADTLPELIDTVGGILHPVELAETALAWDPASLQLDDAAALLFLVQGPANRDQVMLQFAFGEEVGTRTYELNLRYAILQRATGRSMDAIVQDECAQAEGANPDARRTADLMLGLGPGRPDPARIGQAIGLLKTLVAMAPRSTRPAPLCMLAWLSWALGRGSVAGMFIDKALAIDPAYGMAGLLNSLVGSGHLPDWAYRVPLDSEPRA